jgi:hypothetical protein
MALTHLRNLNGQADSVAVVAAKRRTAANLSRSLQLVAL